jgi:L-2-hydroxyglutarate oxidase LhgO
MIGVVSDIRLPAFPAVTRSIQFPSPAQHGMGVHFAAVAGWLAFGPIAELNRHRHRSPTSCHARLGAWGVARSIASQPLSL